MTNNSDEKTRVNAEVPKGLHRNYMETHEHGDLTEDIRRMMRREVGGETAVADEAANDAELNLLDEATGLIETARSRVRERYDDLADPFEDELDALEDELTATVENRVERRRESIDDAMVDELTEIPEDDLAELVSRVENGMHIWPELPKVEQITQKTLLDGEDIVEEVKDRADDRVPDWAFKCGTKLTPEEREDAKMWRRGRDGDYETMPDPLETARDP